ncbi:hypothetical protein ACFWXA_13205 [Streptomyces atroolivaceus]|uniref:hypothetical protein n=1 Tax=Streptomyces atroolivaceus TaxID=66869 RepID=UPI00365F8404
MRGLGWLGGGNDHKLAATKYAGRPSASATAAEARQAAADKKAARKQTKSRIARAMDVRDAARQGQAWEDEDRRRERQRR